MPGMVAAGQHTFVAEWREHRAGLPQVHERSPAASVTVAPGQPADAQVPPPQLYVHSLVPSDRALPEFSEVVIGCRIEQSRWVAPLAASDPFACAAVVVYAVLCRAVRCAVSALGESMLDRTIPPCAGVAVQ